MQIDLFISVISTLRDGSMLEERRMLIDSGTPVTGASVPEDAVAQITLVSPDLPLSAGPHVQIDDLGCWLTQPCRNLRGGPQLEERLQRHGGRR